jgi:hypothetical protein
MSIFKDVLYDPYWQKLRISCLKKYHKENGWGTLAGTEDNVVRLVKYISDSSNETESLRRAWRVLNCMNAVLEGYSGQNVSESARADTVRSYRDKVQELYKDWKEVRTFGTWSWTKVRSDLETLRKEDRIWFDRIYTDLSQKRKSTSTSLQKFLSLMEECMHEA